LKSSHVGSTTANIKVNIALAPKPNGCVIWMLFDPADLAFRSFLWFGGEPNEPLPSLDGFKIGRHSKGNATGEKIERPNIRVVPKGRFEPLATIGEVVERLFGPHNTLVSFARAALRATD
jgi:hypothetical protein